MSRPLARGLPRAGRPVGDERRSEGATLTGERRLVGLVVGDGPSTWRAAGFTVAGGLVDVGGVRIRLAGRAAGTGILGWGSAPPWDGAIDGLPTSPSPPVEEEPEARAAHPNGVTALDHIVVTTPDVERTTAALAEARVLARRTVEGARGDAAVLYRFFLLGTCILEVVGPVVATGAGPARFAGLAFTTRAIDGLGAIATEPRQAVQPGRRIAILRRDVGASVPIAFLTPR
jgi:hypothetical protein